MSKKLIVAAKNFNGRRGTSLYCLSKETFEFVLKSVASRLRLWKKLSRATTRRRLC